jgi:hypothetical protein
MVHCGSIIMGRVFSVSPCNPSTKVVMMLQYITFEEGEHKPNYETPFKEGEHSPY